MSSAPQPPELPITGLPKSLLRQGLLAARRARPTEAGASADQLAPLLPRVRRVASYASLPGEASTVTLHETLAALGVEVLLPRLMADGDLELAGGPLRAGLRGTLAPTGPAEPWSVVDLVVVPALAVALDGVRLGRGGGSYDRVLIRVREGVTVVALLTDGSELVATLPRESHDVAVDAVALPDRLVWLPQPMAYLAVEASEC